MYYFNNLKIKTEEEPKSELTSIDLATSIKLPRNIEEVSSPIITEVSKAKIELKTSEEIDKNYTNSNIVNDVLTTINRIVDEVYVRDPKQFEYVERMAEVRGMEPKVLIDNGCFFCPNPFYMEDTFSDLNLFRNDMHISTADNTLWKGRFIIPMRDFYGKVYGFVGYDKFSSAKYVEYSSPVYKKIAIKALGLNHVDEIIKKKYCILTEGSFDYFRGMQHDFSILANLGVKFNPLLKPLLSKLDVVFTAYDSDEAGKANVAAIQKLHPMVYNIAFSDIQKVNAEGEAYTSKCDMDDSLKKEENVIRLREAIELRVNNPFVKMRGIYL